MTIQSRYRVTVLALAMVLAAALLATVLAKPAWANDTQCVGVVTGVHDNVVVPPGAICTLFNAQVKGNVKALANSRLSVVGPNTIGGNIQGDKANVVEVFFRNTVGGNIEVTEADDAVAVCGTTLTRGYIHVLKSQVRTLLVGGDGVGIPGCGPFGGGNTLEQRNIKVEDNVIGPQGLDIARNQITQDLQVFKNTGPGPKFVRQNVVSENLQCFENTPPFVGGPNAAQKAEGQCTAGLVAPVLAAVAPPVDMGALAEGSDGGATTPLLEETTAP